MLSPVSILRRGAFCLRSLGPEIEGEAQQRLDAEEAHAALLSDQLKQHRNHAQKLGVSLSKEQDNTRLTELSKELTDTLFGIKQLDDSLQHSELTMIKIRESSLALRNSLGIGGGDAKMVQRQRLEVAGSPAKIVAISLSIVFTATACFSGTANLLIQAASAFLSPDSAATVSGFLNSSVNIMTLITPVVGAMVDRHGDFRTVLLCLSCLVLAGA